ncbi:glycerol kinase [Candidatus Hakubella thermalkaliphila]|uniref:Glycerol kinase n=1 Tax=Candidatus Hakubella thermalkaliphila TaxID=2754717 RepID=A0A6V8NRB4_9ACTN|nr:glycerol kinase [Candidatus Hakubella thermalkaliphila]
MEKKYVAAIDQGTTGTRFMIFNHSGQVVSSAYREHRQIYPQAGWVEHDPLEIWVGTQEVIGDALEKGHVDPREISAVGVTNQRETAVIWEKATGQPIADNIEFQALIPAELVKLGEIGVNLHFVDGLIKLLRGNPDQSATHLIGLGGTYPSCLPELINFPEFVAQVFQINVISHIALCDSIVKVTNYNGT